MEDDIYAKIAAMEGNKQAPTATINLADSDAAQEQIANMPEGKTFDLVGSAVETMRPHAQDYMNRTGSGMHGVWQGFGGLEGWTGLISNEDMIAKYDDTAVDAARNKEMELYDKQVSVFNPIRWGGVFLQSAPQMATTVAGGAVGGLVGGLSLPGGAPPAVVAGRYLGAFGATAGPMVGQAYFTYIKNGADPAVARTTSLMVGVTQAAVEMFEYKLLGDVAKKGVSAFVNSKAGKAFMLPLVTGLSANLGKELVAEEAQQVVDQLGRYFAGVSDKVGGEDAITKNGVPQWDKILKEYQETGTQALMGAIYPGAVATYSGLRAGEVKDQLQQIMDNHILATNRAADREAGILETVMTPDGAVAQTKVTGQILNVDDARAAHSAAQAAVDKQNEEMLAIKDEVTLRKETGTISLAEVDSQNARYKKLKKDAVMLRAERDTADLQLQRSIALDRATSPHLNEKEKAEVTKELHDIEKKMRDVEIDAASTMLKTKVAESQKDLKSVDNQIEEIAEWNRLKVEERKDKLQKAVDVEVEKRDAIADKINDAEVEIRGIRTEMAKSVPATQQEDTDALEGNRKSLQKKVDKLEAHIENYNYKLGVLDKKIDKAKNAMSAIADDKFLTKRQEALETQREGIQAKLGNYETISELLQNDLLNSDDLKDLRLKISPFKARTMAAFAAKKLVKAANRNVSKAKVDARRTVKFNQEVLKKLITKSHVPKDAEARLLKRLPNVQTNQQLIRIFEDTEIEIQKVLDKAAADAQRVKLDKIVNTKNVHQEARRFLDLYKHFINDPAAAREEVRMSDEKVTDYLKNLDQMLNDGGVKISEPLPEEVHALLARQTANLADMTSAQVKALSARISKLVETGKDALIEQQERAAEQAKADQEAALKSIDGKKEADVNKPATGVVKFKRTFGDAISPYGKLLEIASQHDPDAVLPKMLDETQHMLDYENNIQKQLHRLIDILAGDGKGNRYWKLLRRMATGGKMQKIGEHAVIGTGNGLGRNGVKEGTLKYEQLQMTRNQAIKLYNQMRDPILKRGLQEGNGYTFKEDMFGTDVSTEEVIENFLTKEDIQIADRLRDFYKEYYKRINEFYTRKNGIPLDYNGDYSGYAQRMAFEGDSLGSETDMLTRLYEQGSTTPGSTKTRMNSPIGLSRADAIIDAIQHVKMFENDMAFGEYASRARRILGNDQVRKKLDAKYGKRFKNHLDTTFTNIIATRRQQDAAMFEILDTIRRNMGAAFTSARPWQIAKQASAMLAFSNYASPVRMAGNYAKMLDPVTFIETAYTLEKLSKVLPTRSENTLLELREAIQKAQGLKDKGELSLGEVLALPTTIGDRASIWVGGGALYKTLTDQGMAPEAAIKIVDKAINETQGSALRNQMTPFELGGSVQRAMSLFTKQPVQIMTAEMNALRRALSLRDAKSMGHLARTVIIGHGMQFFFQAAVLAQAHADGADEEKIDEKELDLLVNTILGPFSGAVLLGDLLHDTAFDLIFTALDKERKGRPPQDTVSSVKTNALKTLHLAAKGFKEGDLSVEDSFRMWHAFNRSFGIMASPLPADAFALWLEKMLNVNSETEVTPEIQEAPFEEAPLPDPDDEDTEEGSTITEEPEEIL